MIKVHKENNPFVYFPDRRSRESNLFFVPVVLPLGNFVKLNLTTYYLLFTAYSSYLLLIVKKRITASAAVPTATIGSRMPEKNGSAGKFPCVNG